MAISCCCTTKPLTALPIRPGHVAGMSLEQVQRLDAGNGQCIPTLEEALKIATGGDRDDSRTQSGRNWKRSLRHRETSRFFTILSSTPHS